MLLQPMMTVIEPEDEDLPTNATPHYYEDVAEDDDEAFFSAEEEIDDDTEDYFSAAEHHDTGTEEVLEEPQTSEVTEEPPAVPMSPPEPEQSQPEGTSTSVPSEEEEEEEDEEEEEEEETAVPVEEPGTSVIPVPVLGPVPVNWKDLRLVRHLGRGSVAITSVFRNMPNRRLVVVKTTSLAHESYTRREAEVIRLVSGNRLFPSAVECLGLPSPSRDTNLFLEYFPGQNLRNFLLERPMIFFEVQCVLRQLGEALRYLHSKNIIHMDVKPENILVNDILQVKLIDFNHSLVGPHARGAVGTRRYQAPEVEAYEWGWTKCFRRKYPYSFKADYYSLGMTTIQMSANLFHMDFLRKVLKKKKKKRKYFPWVTALRKELNPDGIHDSFFDLMSRLLTRNPKKRLGDKDFLSHPFFEEYFQVPLTTVELDPKKVRHSVCMHRWLKCHINQCCCKVTKERRKFEKKVRKRVHAFDMTKERIMELADAMKKKYKKPKKPFWRRIRDFFTKKRSAPQPSENVDQPHYNTQNVQEDGPSGTAGKRSATGLFRRWKKKKKNETLSPSP